jgi:hypothetical protein
MYTRISQSGGRAYLQLVEAYRNDDGKPRQRVLATLGRLDQLRPKDLDPLIAGLQRALGRAPAPLPQVEFIGAKALGDVYALHALWRELGLDSAVSRALRSSYRQFDATAMVRAMVFNRLCEPDSKLGVLRWLDTVAMPEHPEQTSHDHLLRAMDALMDRAGAVEDAVARQLRPLLDDEMSVVFYDLTTVRISGSGKVAGDVRAHGLSKETGGIARQFVLGVIQTREGLPIAHQVHAGNIGEVTTLLPMIEATVQRYHLKRVILIADRGLLSLDNLAAVESLKSASGEPIEYVLAVPGRRYGEFADLVSKVNFVDGVGETRWQDRRLVLAHDSGRAQEQQQAREAAIAALEAEGNRLATRLDAQDEGQPQRGRRSSDRRAYLKFSELTKAARLSRIVKADLQAERFSYTIDATAKQAAEALDGKLLLVTNTDLPAATVIERYKALADIERGFRVLKSDIEIAPVHHRLPERIRAHALICFLALLLHRVLRMRLKANASPLSPQRALALLRQIQQLHVKVDQQPTTRTSQISAEQRGVMQQLKLPAISTDTAP